MASGEQLMEDLFGFAELTGENVTPACKTGVASKIVDKKTEVEPKLHLEKEKIKRDTDEVIVPILFEKSGVKKYKVLARHQVEDDEDIRRPGSSERASPNTEEQRKENINIKQKYENLQKQKSNVEKNIKRQKIKRFEKIGGEHSLKNLKKSLNARFSGKLDKIRKRNHDEKKVQNESTKKSLATFVAKDPRAVNYEFHDDSDSGAEFMRGKAKSETEARNEKIVKSDVSAVKIQDCSGDKSLVKEQVKQSPLKVECHVKLRRDPSIESFYKTLSDSDSKDIHISTISNSDDLIASDSDSKNDNSGININECDKNSGSFESKSVNRQYSSEESRLKITDMVYNADVRVRKSGRLQSSKCASRYRGDYGIRVDTYKQLVSKTANTSCDEKDITGSFENPSEQSNCEDIEATVLETQNSESQPDNVVHSQLELRLGDTEGKTILEKSAMPAETCKSDISSDEFTVLKEPELNYSAADSMLYRTEACSSTEHVDESDLFDNGYKDNQRKILMEQENERKEETFSLVCDSQDIEKVEELVTKSCENENSLIVIKGNEIAENQLSDLEISEKTLEASNETESHSISDGKTEIYNTSKKCDSREPECPNITNEVPCSNVIKEDKSCVNDELTNDIFCRNANNELLDREESQETANVVTVSTEVQTDTKIKRSVESELAKKKINKTLETLQKKSNDVGRESTGYVHSVGKSVNKIQKRMETKKTVSNIRQENKDNDTYPEVSPVKDPAKVLESLRQKLFESAGADVVEADKVPKQFESKLISSKQRQNTDSKSPVMTDTHEKDKQIRDSDSASGRSGKSTPRCSTPRSDASREILEEVAKSLDVLHKAKRKSDSKEKPSKRQRFEEKKFLLRSMMKNTDDVAGIKMQDTETEVENSSDVTVVPGKVLLRSRSSHSIGETGSSKDDSLDKKSSLESSEVKCMKKITDQSKRIEKPVPKPKPVKCSACSHIFKTKELLRKHFPCRIRQTRTWSQNKLRPNRAVKRVETGSKKFVCKLPKSCKQEASNPRPQLLTYRKTKFRRVKGKRRRRLYQLIQDLKQKRMPVKWPHLSVVYDDLSFKEQCLYNLGLICIGSASEGLEKYTAEEITVFEQHRAQERWMTEDTRTFEHSIPELLKTLSDLNVSTEFSTDNQESDYLSPKCVINFSQENIEDRSCDTGSTTEETTEGARNEKSGTELCEVSTLEVTDACPSTLEVTDACPVISYTSSTREREVPWCLTYMHDFVESKINNNYEEAIEFDESPGRMKANFSKQECPVYLRGSTTSGIADAETSPRSQNISRLQTLTHIRESSVSVEEAQELSNIDNIMISVRSNTVDNPLQKAIATEMDVRFSNTDSCVIRNSESISNQESPNLSQQELINLNGLADDTDLISASDIESFSVKEHGDNSKLELETHLKRNATGLEKGNKQETHSAKFSAHHVRPYFEQSSPSYKEEATRKRACELDSKVTDERKIVSMGVTPYSVKTQEPLKKFSSKKKSFAAPDIELYHQTAIIDDKILDSSPFAQLERASETDTGEFHTSGSQPILEKGNGTEDNTVMKSDLHHDLIFQASEMLENILEDVGQTVTDCKHTPELVLDDFSPNSAISGYKSSSEKNVAVLSKVTNENTSPVKGILKTVCSKKDYTPSSPVITSDIRKLAKENSLKSPGKRKIDFKTYAKRKGMIKEKDEMDKECMRSETHEIEEGLLGRLLDAVNVIDSIIEEHKDQIEPEEDEFSAITPEMAFEAAMLSSKIENSSKEEADKLYDIESVYPYSEVGNIFDIEPNHSTTSADLSEEIENDLTKVMKMEGYSDGNTNVWTETKSKFIEPRFKENVNIAESDNQNIEVGSDVANTNLENKFGKEMEVHNGVVNSATDVANLGSSVNSDGQPGQEPVKCYVAIAMVKSTGDISVDIDSLKENNEKETVEDLNECSDDKKIREQDKRNTVGMPIAADKDFTTSVDVGLKSTQEGNGEIGVIPSVIDEDATVPSPEDIAFDINPIHKVEEVMKSPDHIPKRQKKSDEATTIKESNRDFTIKYEMNGIVVKENLLTGDKNVVENSSPFRSSADSDSNFDQSSQSELDVSSAVENDNSFHSNADVRKSDSVHSVTNITSKSNKHIPFKKDTLGKTGQVNEDDHVLSPEATVKSDHFAADTEDADLKKLQEHKTEIDLNNEKNIHTEIYNLNEKKSFADESDRTETEYIESSVSSPSFTENKVCTDFDIHEENHEFDSSSEAEPLPVVPIQVLRKNSDDLSVGSPPLLEKVDVAYNDLDEDNSSQSIDISLGDGPPILEPQHLEENEQSSDEQNETKATYKARPERHFLDVLGIAGNEVEDVTTFPEIEKKLEKNIAEKDATRSGKTILEELCNEESALNDSIGRHFSDAVSETVDVPKTPKSKLQFLFDKSERGEVTLAQIKDILAPFSKGKETFIPKESLLKIKTGIANLLSKVKKPVRKDPSWLKRDALSNYYRKQKIKKREEIEELESSCEESLSDQEEIYYTSNDSLDSTEQNGGREEIENSAKKPSKRSVADTILQMLTSLEDKGSIADNMSNLLDILAENLGFLGKGSINEQGYESSSDSDYDYSHTGETILTCDSSSTENTQKDLIADFLVEGDQPPSLDDIPTAGNSMVSWNKESDSGPNKGIERDFEDSEMEEMASSDRCVIETGKTDFEFIHLESDRKQTKAKKDQLKEKHIEGQKQVVNLNFECESGQAVDKKIKKEVSVNIFESESERKTTPTQINNSMLDFKNSEEVSLTSEQPKDEKRKASTIFKSITELNSIETDEESNSGESFDPVSMSERLSELKALAKENTAWEFNSNFDSDQDDSDKFDSDFEKEVNSVSEHYENEDIKKTPCLNEDMSEYVNPTADDTKNLTFNEVDTETKKLKEGGRKEIIKSSVYLEGNTISSLGQYSVSSPISRNLVKEGESLNTASDEDVKVFENTFRIDNNIESEEDTLSYQSHTKNVDFDPEKEQAPKEDGLSGNCIPAISDLPVSKLLQTSESTGNICSGDKHTANVDSAPDRVTTITEQKEIVSEYSGKNGDGVSSNNESDTNKLETDTENVEVHLQESSDQDDDVLKNDTDSRKIVSNASTTEVENIYDNFEEHLNIASMIEKKKRTEFHEDTADDISYNNKEGNLKSDQTKVIENSCWNFSEIDSLHVQLNLDKTAEKTESNDIDSELRTKIVSNGEKIKDSFENTFHDTVISEDDVDTNETVAYDDLEGARTDFTDMINDINNVNLNLDLQSNCVRLEDGKLDLCLHEENNQEDKSEVNTSGSYVADRKENENDTIITDQTVTLSLLNKENSVTYCSDIEDSNLKEGDAHSDEEEMETKKRSTSFNIDSSDFSDLFCETIAEKVKRKQRDRSKSVCYNFNPLLYYSAAYVREVTKPAKRELSVFRSSILEKRAREKSVSPEKAVEGCPSRKKRNSSVPKEADISYQRDNTESTTSNNANLPEIPFQLKPCAVVIPKLTDDIIKRYTARKRKSVEDSSENRPPIKVTIKLSQIVYPPNSPYGSTSMSSDACRSGYGSCSEESESDTNQLDDQHACDSEGPINVNSEISEFESVICGGVNGISEKEVDCSSREPLKIKMRTWLTKMNSFEESVDSPNPLQGVAHLEQLNESSNETNIEVNTRELIESEVLHDIKLECEKVKSREKDVSFYLSDSENESAPDATKKVRKLHRKKETEKKQNLFGVDRLSDTPVVADYGESDVDLSDSDTDSQIQEEIKKILNANSSEDFSTTLEQDIVEETSSMKMGEGKSAIMKMIVSDLRLSESESESEADFNLNGKERGILKETTEGQLEHCVEDSEIHLIEKREHYQHELPLKAFQTKHTGAEVFDYSYPGLFKSANESVKESVFANSGTENSKLQSSKQQHQDNDSASARYPSEKNQNFTKNIFEALDLSKNSQDHQSPISNEVTGMCTNSDAVVEKFSSEFEHLTSVDFSKGCISNNQACEDKQNKSVDKSNQEAVLYNSKIHKHTNTSFSPRDVSLFEEVTDKEKPEVDLRTLNSSKIPDKPVENTDATDNKADEDAFWSPEYHIQKTNEEDTTLKDSSGIIDATSTKMSERETNSSGKSLEGISEKKSLTLEDSKELENVNAVKNLEEDTFQDVQTVQDSIDEDMIYYAVELSDDLETNEAVVNLESVELIEGPIIIENNDTHEENILDTSVVQSHVNDQFELQNEPVNEQIVETLNDSKHCSELTINSALESMTHMENPVIYPVINDVKSKYLYGINEDSQSSNEVVEELVTDNIVSDSVVLQHVEHTINKEEEQIFHEEIIVESPSEKFPGILNITGVQSLSKEPVFKNQNTDSCVELGNDITYSSNSCMECKSYAESENPIDDMEKRPYLNISENVETRNMCSGQESLNEFEVGEFTGTSDGGRTRLSDGNGVNSFLQSYEECGMIVECSDENDYIITQNEHFDEDSVMDTS